MNENRGGSALRLVRVLEANVAARDWMDEAECRGMDVNLFFPDRTDSLGRVGNVSTVHAKAVCARCPVQPQCLDYALATNERDGGVWGGATDAERRRMKRRTA